MSRTVYHILPDEEPFSEHNGGGLSRWCANVLRDDPDAKIVAPSADQTWGFASDRVLVTPSLERYGRNRYLRQIYRQSFTFLRDAIIPSLHAVKPGDVLWVQNDRKHAAALAGFAKEKGAALVLHMHNSIPIRTTSRKVIRELAKIKIVCCSNFLKEETERNFPELKAYRVLLNGADAKRFSPRESTHNAATDGPMTVLFAGRLVKEKGIHVLIDAMRLLEQRGVSARCLVVGATRFGGSKPNSYVRGLQRRAPANVEFLGYLPAEDLVQTFRDSHIYTAPSDWNDPFPAAIIEAMASGLPVVASRRGGIPEAFRDGGGILVSSGSAIELADALQNILSDPALQQKLSKEARASFLKNFTWSTICQGYREIIDSL
jgi:spore coat protein SA